MQKEEIPDKTRSELEDSGGERVFLWKYCKQIHSCKTVKITFLQMGYWRFNEAELDGARFVLSQKN